jgi:hypothetical protein
MNCLFCTYQLDEDSNVVLHRIDDEGYMAHADCLATEELSANLDKPRYIVSVWRCGRANGGPEEGGWSYEYGDLITSIEVDEEEAVEHLREGLSIEYPYTGKRSSILGGSDYNVTVHDRHDCEYDTLIDERLNLVSFYPQHTPHYE